jgi:CRISPR/Cas system CSM-associated protein Csm3 (group 7 of RAMP superfamily)
MTRIRLAVTLTLRGPILTHASGAGPLGVDAVAARRPDGRCYLPFSLVKGGLRQSWDELQFPDGESWFGRRLGGWSATRGRFRFTDFVEDGGGAPRARRHRIQIDEETGAADDGMLQTIESPFAPRQTVMFRGEVAYFARADEDAEAVRERLRSALAWTRSLGSGRTIGFGQLLGAKVETEVASNEPAAALDGADFDYAIVLRDPFCFARRRIAGNLFESDTVIPGAAIRGVAATTLNDVLGRASSAVIDASVSDPEWKALATHFNRISVSHAFPSLDTRPVKPPLSLVVAGGTIHDVALQEGPGLIGGEAPRFEVDWKDGDFDASNAPWNWPDFAQRKQLRVRTAIDRRTRRAADEQLFAHELIRPEGITWRGRVSFAPIPEGERAAVVEQFARLFALEPAAWGKTKARGRLTLVPAESRPVDIGEPPWAVTLQTPALLCDPSGLDEQSGGDALFDAYASSWHEMSDGKVKLVRFFARQTLAGGYLVHRFRRGKPYAPFVLTDAGSVFVIEPAEAGAKDFIEGIATRGLPLPRWVAERYGETWDRNPYLPMDGFGEVAVNLPVHREPIEGFTQIERWTHEWNPPADEKPAARESTDEIIAREEDDLEIGSSSPVPFGKRWRITATLETRSELHIGSGEPIKGRVTRKDDAGNEVDVNPAAVSVDAKGRAYLPGSGLKGALRAWLTMHHPARKTDIARLFGRAGDAKDANGGVVEVLDAFATDDQNAIEHVPFWDANRLTGVTASAAIDRKTRTAQDEKLFHREYVPPGIRFDLVLCGDGLSSEDATLVCSAIEALNAPDGMCLGAETREGWGRMASSGVRADWTMPAAWLDAKRWTVATIAPVDRTARASVLRVEIRELAFTGPFLVNEPSRTKAVLEEPPEGSDVPKPPDHAPRVGTDGKVVLPVSSFRGALRARAEKIVRSLGGKACMVTDSHDACRAIDAASSAKDLCLVCQLFGATGWATPIRFEPFMLVEKPKDYEQELVAIDRFTGGVSGSAKFDVNAVWRPRFTSAMSIDLSRWDALAQHRDAAMGLLLLALRDVAEGDMTLGFGASKGYGACEAKIAWPGNTESLVDVFRMHLGCNAEDRPAALAPSGAAGAVASDSPPPAPAEGTDEFFNPYHFVGVSATAGPGAVPASKLDAAEHLSHAAAAKNTYSGRILCRLTTLTPVVVGAKQNRPDKNNYATVEPFRHPESGQPALPATSLRGLVSSIAEAASNSALRVLANTAMSYRCRVEDNLTEIGMIVDGRQLVLLTTLKRVPSGREPVFVGRYVKAGKDTLAYDGASFLGRPPRPNSYSPDHRDTWYLDRRNPRRDPIDHDAWSSLDRSERAHYEPGILRILGIEGREKEMPTQKAHEIFIPVDPTALQTAGLDATEAIELFERLAAQRYEADASLPFEVQGSSRNGRGSGPIKLRPGDLVFFEPAADGKKVERLAISSIWRRATDGDVFAFFRSVSKELLPIHPDRETISIAEQMFGYVEGGVKRGRARARASRIRPSIGVLVSAPGTGALMPPVPLEILSSPKLPAPAFYFRPKNGEGWIAKRELTASKHVPRGRKMYLHQNAAWHGEPWKTQHDEDRGQKNIVTPIARGAEFAFHFDFENLTRLELGLLCYALRPAETFRHKLGLGKSIGLGSVRIDPLLLLSKDAGRYRRPWRADAGLYDRCESIAAADVRDADASVAALPAPAASDTFAVLRDEYRAAMMKVNPRIIESLELIGDPSRWKHPAHTPQLPGSDLEKKTYEWFMRNDRPDVEPQSLGILGVGDPKPLHRTIRDRPVRATAQPRPPRPPRNDVQPPPQPAPRNAPPPGEDWAGPDMAYDERQGMIIATNDGGHDASRSAGSDDPDVLRIGKGERPARVRVRLMPNRRRTILAIDWPGETR